MLEVPRWLAVLSSQLCPRKEKTSEPSPGLEPRNRLASEEQIGTWGLGMSGVLPVLPCSYPLLRSEPPRVWCKPSGRAEQLARLKQLFAGKA